MKIPTTLMAFCFAAFVYSQSTGYVAVQAGGEGSSEEVDLNLFHLNHVLYANAFILSDIYSTISPKDMAVVSGAVHKNAMDGKRTNFMITTQQKVPYRLTVTVFKNKSTKDVGLVILTNFNAKKGKFEKKTDEAHYAKWCPLEGNVVTGSIFALPMEDKEKYTDDNDHISLLNMHVFNTICNSGEMLNWFVLAEETQPDKINNRNFLKAYYYLSQNDFDESENWLEELKVSVATFSIEEQNGWAMPIQVLATEIKTMRELKNE